MLGSLPPAASIQSVAIAPPVHTGPLLTEQEGSVHSLSALLNTPIPTSTVLKPHALVLSPALPPIPNRLADKIRGGTFVEMKELLGDNIALLQRLEEVQGHPSSQLVLAPTSARLREVSSPLTWVSCFLSYTAVRCRDVETRSLLIYARLVLDLARKHGWRGWLDYDRVFRQQIAANSGLFSWSELNPSLMAYTVPGSTRQEGLRTVGSWCPLCQEADHRASECALQALEPIASSPSRSGPVRPTKARVSSRYDPLGEICRKFNKGTCNIIPCKYRHVCKQCHKDHSWLACPAREGDSKH